jgi:fucose 4-O-acetylase-like acetyltransferase
LLLSSSSFSSFSHSLLSFLEFLVELLFFETTGPPFPQHTTLTLLSLECLWIHYSLPSLVQADVEDAVRTLYNTLDMAFSNMVADNLVFNMPQFLFVSHQVLSSSLLSKDD